MEFSHNEIEGLLYAIGSRKKCRQNTASLYLSRLSKAQFKYDFFQDKLNDLKKDILKDFLKKDFLIDELKFKNFLKFLKNNYFLDLSKKNRGYIVFINEFSLIETFLKTEIFGLTEKDLNI